MQGRYTLTDDKKETSINYQHQCRPRLWFFVKKRNTVYIIKSSQHFRFTYS